MTVGDVPGLAHTFAAAGTYEATLTVTDKDGGSSSTTFPVTVLGAAPTVPVTGAGTTAEGSEYSITLGAISPDAVPVSGYTIHWGDGSPAETYTQSPEGRTHTHTYVDGVSGGTVTVDLVAGGLTFPAAGSHAVSVTERGPDHRPVGRRVGGQGGRRTP